MKCKVPGKQWKKIMVQVPCLSSYTVYVLDSKHIHRVAQFHILYLPKYKTTLHIQHLPFTILNFQENINIHISQCFMTHGVTTLNIMISSIFWDFTQLRLVVWYQMFQDNISVPSSGVKKGPIGCPETLVSNYHSTLCNMPEEWRYHLHHSRSLKSHSIFCN